MIFILIILVIILIIVVFYLKKENKSLHNYLLENNDLLEKLKLVNHENKNQLLVIKGKIKNGDTDLCNYIDLLLDEKIMDNETFFYLTSKIPSSGLRGLIFSKVSLMKENKINVDLQIGFGLNDIDLDKLGISFVKDLCKIIGVFLDNAYEASLNCSFKEVIIGLNMLDKNKLLIVISNTYDGKLNSKMMSKKRFTTKGKNHGFGLSIVKKIVNKNNRFKNETIIKENIFIQKLEIDLDN
jgi:two-component system sensor histidine kinase AgrC